MIESRIPSRSPRGWRPGSCPWPFAVLIPLRRGVRVVGVEHCGVLYESSNEKGGGWNLAAAFRLSLPLISNCGFEETTNFQIALSQFVALRRGVVEQAPMLSTGYIRFSIYCQDNVYKAVNGSLRIHDARNINQFESVWFSRLSNQYCLCALLHVRLHECKLVACQRICGLYRGGFQATFILLQSTCHHAPSTASPGTIKTEDDV